MVLAVSLVAAVLGTGGLAAIIQSLMSKGKIAADASSVLTNTALTLVVELRKDIESLREEIKQLEAERDKLSARIACLEKKL